MISSIARVLGLLMLANAIFDFTFPDFATRFFLQGPGRTWRFPGREIVENVACLTPTTRRYLAAWEGLIGGMLMLLGRQQHLAAMGQITRGPVRIPIQQASS